jgi:hypothetical protein
VLRIDGHAYSATVLHRILHMAAVSSSFGQAGVSLQVIGELDISARQINKLTKELGSELAGQRDAQTERFINQPLPRQATAPSTPIDLAATCRIYCLSPDFPILAALPRRSASNRHVTTNVFLRPAQSFELIDGWVLLSTILAGVRKIPWSILARKRLRNPFATGPSWTLEFTIHRVPASSHTHRHDES